MSDEKTVQPNDVKKGWEVKIGGKVAVVFDNRKGMLRMIQFKAGQGLFDDIGDEYVYKWTHAREDDTKPWTRVVLPEKLQKQADKIRRWGF